LGAQKRSTLGQTGDGGERKTVGKPELAVPYIGTIVRLTLYEPCYGGSDIERDKLDRCCGIMHTRGVVHLMRADAKMGAKREKKTHATGNGGLGGKKSSSDRTKQEKRSHEHFERCISGK